jgi:hypothetical protein
MQTCAACGEVYGEQFSSCWKCAGSSSEGRGSASAAQGTGTIRLTTSQATVSVTNFGPASKARYAEAYTSARTFSSIGKIVKGIGVLIFLMGVARLMSSGGNEYGGGGEAMSAGITALTGGMVFMMGLFMAAQAQLQMSCLDSAVHTCPFLNDIQRAETMRLRLG